MIDHSDTRRNRIAVHSPPRPTLANSVIDDAMAPAVHLLGFSPILKCRGNCQSRQKVKYPMLFLEHKCLLDKNKPIVQWIIAAAKKPDQEGSSMAQRLCNL